MNFKWYYLLPVLLLTCASQKAVVHPRACVHVRHIEQAKGFLAASYKSKPTWFKYKQGTKPIILVAPHAVPASRSFADRGTGPLVRLLGKLTGAHVLYTCGKPPCDPNRDARNAFKKALNDLIDEINPKLVLDFHQAHNYRPFDIDFGTQRGRTCPPAIIRKLTRCLKREGLRNFSQDYFPAIKHHTITQACYEKNTCALQVEVNTNWLTLDDPLGAQRFAQLTQGLINFLECVHR